MANSNNETIVSLASRLAFAIKKNRIQRARLRAVRQYIDTLSTGPSEWDDAFERGESLAEARVRRNINKIMSETPVTKDRRTRAGRNPYLYGNAGVR